METSFRNERCLRSASLSWLARMAKVMLVSTRRSTFLIIFLLFLYFLIYIYIYIDRYYFFIKLYND